MAKKIIYKEGDRVRIRQWGGGTRIGIIEAYEDDIKDGEPGYDYVTEDGKGYWCYAYQIIGRA